MFFYSCGVLYFLINQQFNCFFLIKGSNEKCNVQLINIPVLVLMVFIINTLKIITVILSLSSRKLSNLVPSSSLWCSRIQLQLIFIFKIKIKR
jgi:hypothetical protein